MDELTKDDLLKLGFNPILMDGDLCFDIKNTDVSLWYRDGIIFIAYVDCPNFAHAIPTIVKTVPQLWDLVTVLGGNNNIYAKS